MTAGGRLKTGGKPSRAERQEGYPEVTPAFTWIALALATWVLLGTIVDINAHNHDFVDDTFFTPWHMLMYSGMAANGLFFVVMQYHYVGRGHSLLKALPREYLLSFAGVLLFGVGGVLDLGWHEIFGFEASTDALVSPTHLLLVLAGIMFMSGPLRSFLSQGRTSGSWAELFPPIASALTMLTIGTLFTLFANGWTQLDHFVTPEVEAEVITQSLSSLRPLHTTTITSVLIPAALFTGVLLFLRQRMVLPFGAVTFVLLVNALFMIYIRWQWTSEHAIVLLAPLVAGLLGDWLLSRPPAGSPIIALRQFAFLVPFVCTLGMFVILQLTAGMWWSIHMWLGVSFMAGAVGVGMSSLLTTRELPQAA